MPAVLGPQWTALNLVQTTNFGSAGWWTAAEQFMVQSGQTLELEALLYNDPAAGCSLGVAKRSNDRGVYVSNQSDGNVVSYRYTGSTAVLLASGATATVDINSMMSLMMRFHVHDTSNSYVEFFIDGYKQLTAAVKSQISADMTGILSPILSTAQPAKIFSRARVLG
jgi:hypothetical protein